MKSIEGHFKRTLPKLHHVLSEPRRGVRRWTMKALLGCALKGMLSGCKNLRQLESLTALSGVRIPDTTLHDFLEQLDSTPMNKIIADGVKKASRSHELDSKELPIQLTVIDGKSLTASKTQFDEYSSNHSKKGSEKYVSMALRAFLVSSTLKLHMGQLRIPSKRNEMSSFRPFLNLLLELYGRTKLLHTISLDAGFTSVQNAASIVEHNLHYIMALKDATTRKITQAAIRLLGEKNPDHIEHERYNGKDITRELFRCKAENLAGWEHARQLWRIKKTTSSPGAKKKVENHYFVTNLATSCLSNKQVLKAIRLHWGVENNANWVMDTAWSEDSSPWCRAALDFVSLLRIIAYNAIARLKFRRLRNGLSLPWRLVLTLVERILFPLKKQCITLT